MVLIPVEYGPSINVYFIASTIWLCVCYKGRSCQQAQKSKCVSLHSEELPPPQIISVFSYFSVDLSVFSHKESIPEAVEGGGARRSQVSSCQPAGWQPIRGVAFHWSGRRWRH